MEVTMPDTNTEAKSYFATFPRELRDLIYDQLYQEIDEVINGLDYHTCAIIPRLRSISRQFRAEYDERIATDDFKQALTVTDTGSRLYERCSKIPCPRISTHTTCLTINLVEDPTWCHVLATGRAYIQFTLTWHDKLGLEKLVTQLPLLRRFRLRVCDSISDSAPKKSPSVIAYSRTIPW